MHKEVQRGSMDKSYKEAFQRLAEEYISKVKCCDECFAESFCIEQQRRESRLPCKDKMKCVYSGTSLRGELENIGLEVLA